MYYFLRYYKNQIKTLIIEAEVSNKNNKDNRNQSYHSQHKKCKYIITIFDYIITRMPLYTRTIILCNIFLAISHASLVLCLIVSGKSKSTEHNIIEISQHFLQVFLFTISGSASNRLKIVHVNQVRTYVL